jgi:hypothetical protein
MRTAAMPSPAASVRVSALLPAIGKTLGQMFDIKPGDNTLDLTFEYTDPANAPPAASASDRLRLAGRRRGHCVS